MLAFFLGLAKAGLLYGPTGQYLLFLKGSQFTLPEYFVALRLRKSGNLQREQPLFALQLLLLQALVAFLINQAFLYGGELLVEGQRTVQFVSLTHRSLHRAITLRGHTCTTSS